MLFVVLILMVNKIFIKILYIFIYDEYYISFIRFVAHILFFYNLCFKDYTCGGFVLMFGKTNRVFQV